MIKTCSDQNVPFSVLVAARMLGCGIHSILDNYSAGGDSVLPLLAFFLSAVAMTNPPALSTLFLVCSIGPVFQIPL